MNDPQAFTKLPGPIHEWLAGMKHEVDDMFRGDFEAAAALLEIRRRADAMLDTIKERQYQARIGVIGESEEIKHGVKIRVAAPTRVNSVDTPMIKSLENDDAHCAWLHQNGYISTMYKQSDRKGSCSITEVK